MSEFSAQVIKQIDDEYGEGIIKKAARLFDQKRKVISVTPMIDQILSGGIPEGCWATFTGKPKTGKTTMSLQFAKNWQAADDYREVYYGNVEHRLKEMNLEACRGLDRDRFHVIESNKEKILSAQDFLKIFSKILRDHPNTLLIVDSFALLSEEAEQVGGVGTQTRGGGAKLVAQFCRDVAQVIPINNSIVLGITHQMANTSGFGASMVEKGGNAIWYQADVKLKVTGEAPWIIGPKESGKKIGKVTKWHCECSALGPPYGETESYHRFGSGIDEIAEAILLGTQLGLIGKKGAWFYPSYFTIEEGLKFQGHDNMTEAFYKRPELYTELIKAVNKMLGVAIES